MTDALNQLAMQWMRDTAPFCDTCGARYQLGGAEGLGPMFVCTTCSFTASVNPEWLERQRDLAYDYAERKLS